MTTKILEYSIIKGYEIWRNKLFGNVTLDIFRIQGGISLSAFYELPLIYRGQFHEIYSKTTFDTLQLITICPHLLVASYSSFSLESSFHYLFSQ